MILRLHQEDLDFGIPPSTHLTGSAIKSQADISLHACKEIQGQPRFWIPRHGFRILGTGFRILCQLNLDSGFHISGIPDSWILFQIPDSGFHKQKIPWFRDSESVTCGKRDVLKKTVSEQNPLL